MLYKLRMHAENTKTEFMYATHSLRALRDFVHTENLRNQEFLKCN